MDRIDPERLAALLSLRGDERVLEVGPGAIPGATVDEAQSDFTTLPFEGSAFDAAAALWTVRRVKRPELLVAELTRVTKRGGTILVVDQVAPVDPLAALELNQAARQADPSVTRILAEADLRALFDANNLRLRREDVAHEASGVDVGWFVLTR
jgi:ubiquinone/menaquinone biosynthesis C-methylase UbiE